MADPHQTEVSKLMRFRRFLRENKAFIELCGLLAALAVLCTYCRANRLTAESIALTKKQVMAAHVPWVGIEEVQYDATNKHIIVVMKNYSDSPALNLSYSIQPGDVKNVSGVNYKNIPTKHIIFPLQSNSEVLEITNNDPAKLETAIADLLNGNTLIKYKINYEDVFGRKFAVVTVIEGIVPKNMGQPFATRDTVFEGLEQLK